jgi:5-methylcytosine-specific restriction protein B
MLQMVDRTRYQFNHKVYGKGALVLAVIKQYVADTQPDYDQLKSTFPADLQGSNPVVISAHDLQQRKNNSSDERARYFENEGEALTVSDGFNVFVSNRWGIGNIGRFISKAQELGFEISKAGEGMKSIKELYEEYKNNVKTERVNNFRNRCHQLATYKGKSPGEYDTALLKDIWEKRSNGIANASPGFMSKAEFDSLLDELPGITSKIVENPSPETLDEVMKWAEQAKRDGKFQTVKKGVINRVFAAARPQAYSSILKRRAVVKLIRQLNKNYDLPVKTDGNWAELNVHLLDLIRSQGLENEDVFLLNTFAWKLYELMSSDDLDEKDDEKNEALTTDNSAATCKNIIYYGPPGTGKTFKLQQLLKDDYTEEHAAPDETVWLAAQIDSLSWLEVIIMILMQADEPLKVADIVKHEYYQIKAQLNDREKNLAATAWAALQSHTVSDSKTVNLSTRMEPLVFDKTEGSAWFLDERQSDQLEDMKATMQQIKQGPGIEESIKRFEFVTFHQSFSYEEFIEGLRPKTNANGDIEYEVRAGVFKRICNQAELDPDNQYALVIDEINRGNISKIFGELITLIEVDKRSGCANELTLTLPYSGSTFCVPANLDIIGTMNTADRSLTHIDVALRRRFHFKELRTDYALISDDVEGINLRWMLYAINQRIELLLDREHILGHALLMHVASIDELGNTFKTSIMPLLEEYFFEDWDKINRVLNNNGFIEEQQNAYSIWLGGTDDYSAKSYRVNSDAFNNSDAYQTIYNTGDVSVFDGLN